VTADYENTAALGIVDYLRRRFADFKLCASRKKQLGAVLFCNCGTYGALH